MARFSKDENAEIRRIVYNFNRKRNRAIKRGIRNLPPQLYVSELKKRYTHKSQFRKQLRLLEEFNLQGRDALREVETAGGAKAIKWEYEYLKANLEYAKKYYERQIAEGVQLSTDKLIAQSEYLVNMKAKRDYLDLEISQLTPSQYKTFRKTIDEALNENLRNAAAYRGWLNEVEFIMKNMGYDEDTINEFFKGFEDLTPQQFITLYHQSNLVNRIYELYLPTKDFNFRLSTSEEDARNLIDTFMEEKETLIAKAKAQERLIKDKGLERFVKSLTKKEMKKIPEQAAKLKRKDLTKEDIEALKILGWEDLIE